MAIEPVSEPPATRPKRQPDEPLRGDAPLDRPADDELGTTEYVTERSLWMPIAIAVVLMIGITMYFIRSGGTTDMFERITVADAFAQDTKGRQAS